MLIFCKKIMRWSSRLRSPMEFQLISGKRQPRRCIFICICSICTWTDVYVSWVRGTPSLDPISLCSCLCIRKCLCRCIRRCMYMHEYMYKYKYEYMYADARVHVNVNCIRYGIYQQHNDKLVWIPFNYISSCFTLWYFNIAIEHCSFIVDLLINHENLPESC